MKLFLGLTACLLLATGSHAFLGKLGDFLHELGHDLGAAAKPVGKELLSSLKTTGKELLSNTVQDLLLHLGNLETSQPAATRREVDMPKIQSFLKGIETFISNKADHFQYLYEAAVDKLGSVENKVKSLEFLKEPLENLLTEVEDTVAGHTINANHLLDNIASEAVTFLKPLLGVQKRGILDSLGLNQIGQTLANLFKPHIDSLKTLVSSAGGTLKDHATGLLGAVKGSVNELGTKLSTHVDTLKTHLGTITSTAGEALATLKDAIGQVMQDTFSSLHNPLTGIVNTLTNATGTVVKHLG